MGRKTKITKEDMLSAGLRMIIESGYASLSIKSLSEHIGCSTQPVSWSFGSFEGYLAELRPYAYRYFDSKMREGEEYIHDRVGYSYIATAASEPNLIRYLRDDEPALRKMGGIGGIFNEDVKANRVGYYMSKYSLSKEEAIAFCEFAIIFSEGIVSLILSGVLPSDAEYGAGLLTSAATAKIIQLKGNEN